MTLTEDLTGRPLGNGKYELRERIGRGGMAEVYRAYQQSLERDVAVKVLHAFLSDDPEFKERFEREAKNIAKLRHNHILQVYDFEFEPGPDLFYMVMEFVDGPTLRTELLEHETRGERIPTEEVINISRDLASALAYAYKQHQMIHRDIKPGNVMMDQDDKRIVLTDFGIAKIVSGQHITASGTMIGTPAYMAPEQGLGQPGDHRSDIYSLGVVMYQMAAGAPPYEADTPIALVLKHVNDPLPSLSSFVSGLPEGLERIIYKCLAKDPEERFQEAEDLVANLENMEAAASLSIPEGATEHHTAIVNPSLPRRTIVKEPPTVAERSARRGVISPYLAGSIGAAVVAVIIGSIIFLGGGPNSTEATPPPTQLEAAIVEEAESPVEPIGEAAPEVDTTATPDAELTALAATIEIFRANRATQAAVATRPVLGTDLAPLIESGCDLDYELVSEAPGTNVTILEFSIVSKEFVFRNTGECAWESGVVLVFVDGSQMDAPEEVVVEQTISPGDRATFTFDLILPEFAPSDRIVQSTWQLSTMDGRRIGRLVSFNVEIVPPTATPTPTQTPTNTPTTTPSATPTGTPNSTGDD